MRKRGRKRQWRVRINVVEEEEAVGEEVVGGEMVR